MKKDRRPAVILLSGGLDSTTCLALAKKDGYLGFALTFSYGQRHEFEIEAAKRIAGEMGTEEHLISEINLRSFGGSALTSNLEVPKDTLDSNDAVGIPITYVPARNTIFLSFALAWAEVLNARDIFIGVNALDYSGYPDCRPEYIKAFENMSNLATRIGVEGGRRIKIHTPLIAMTKADIIKTGTALGVDFSLTRSCYDPRRNGDPCGHCEACQLRLKGFMQAGIKDGLTYPEDTKS
ncbi:MAG: 7-cyano-7-deazaguanine synthase QueC [Candidatus Neomarinimicrobiota bacterium]